MRHGSYHTLTGHYHIYDKPFSTKISSFTIITRSCILGEKVLKMNDCLTYFGAEISNVQILCYFAFSFFKFWIIPSPSCNSFKCTRISKRNGTNFFKILQCCFCDWHIHKLYYSWYEGCRAKELLNLFDTIYTSSIHFSCSKRNSSLLLILLIHFLRSSLWTTTEYIE